MKSRHKLIISSKNIYKEVELPPEISEISIGTSPECDVRLRKELFFSPVILNLYKVGEEWNIDCSDELYLTTGDIRKFYTLKLKHGDELVVKYQKADIEVFDVAFMIDFDNGKIKYERAIDVSHKRDLTIGEAASNDISINSPFINGDRIRLVKDEEGAFEITLDEAFYGIYHNGNKATVKSKIKDGDFFSISDFFFYYKKGKLWTQIRSDCHVNNLEYTDKAEMNSYPKFNRNTRIKTVINDEKIEVLDPPSKPQKPKNNLFMRLMPSMGMLIASFAMAFMGGHMIIFSAISGLMAILTAIVGFREEKKDFKKNCTERIEKYNAYIAQKKEEIETLRDEELEALEKIYLSQQKERDNFKTFSPALFDRSKEDEDFLCVRLGKGAVEAKREINYKKQEKLEVEDDLQQMPEAICEEYKYVAEAPVVCDLKENNAIGIVGLEEHRFEFLKNIVIDVIARQYFTDVKMFFIAQNENKDRVHWLRMLPHVYNEEIGVRNIVCDDESRNLIFEYLYKELSIREEAKQYNEHILIFFYDEYGFKSHPISKFVDKAADLGVTFVFFGEHKADIPMGCGHIIAVKDNISASLVNTEDSGKTLDFSYPVIDNNHAAEIVQLMAPVYTEEISLEGSLTKNISLFELLNIIAVEDIDLKKRWASSQVFKSMAAPIGVSTSGIVELDLHDKAHGPHGLVAGTTGSGKSEILQTYILAMATMFHPYEVAFVIIDFKGGGMVNQFRGMPHLLGAITNIDGKEIDRSLKSIKAELQKRQRLFAEADVNHIDKYIKKFKAGEVSEPLPHLIIVVDEFAELKAEQPEFMKELISAARIGRSLGVHLILATQKPSGQVNEQIWSNSRFKLCLKVQGPEDSNEVLKSPLAAEIKEPGRAYLQVGNNEIFELFQSAYSGAPEKEDDSKLTEFSIYSLTESGKKVPVFVQKKKKGEGNTTQLDAIVSHVNSYFEETKLRRLPDICLPSLSHVIDFPTVAKPVLDSNVITADIGIYDDPDNQYQGAYSIDLTNQNLMIIGSAQSGKTNILQNIIRSISSKYSTEDVNIYIMDFASMVLKSFEPLNHVGGVVTSSDDEKLKNLIKLLYSEIETRKEKLLSLGVSSFAAYREAGKRDLPQIVLIIDNLTALKELYFQDDEELLNLCREGLSVGISIVIANSQTAGIGYKYLSNFGSRIAMFCNDTGEYGSLFEHCRMHIDDIHGRCIIEIDKTHLECQSYLAFKGEKEIDRAEEIKEYIAETNKANIGNMAKLIPVIPDFLTRSFVETNLAGYMTQKYSLVTGFEYSSVSPFVLQLNNLSSPLVISGREKSGKHNFIKYTASMIDKLYGESADIYVVDGIGRKLTGLSTLASVKSYDFLTDKVTELIPQIESELKTRYEALSIGRDDVLEESKLIVLILNSYEVLEAISSNMALLESYKNIIGRYKNMNVCVIVGGYENNNITYSAPEVIKNMRDAKHFLFFDDLANLKIVDLPLATLRTFKKPIETGDCYYIKDNECMKIKTVHA